MKQILFRIIAVAFVIGACEIAAKVMVYLFLGLTSTNFLNYYTNDKNLTLVAWNRRYTVHPYFGYKKGQLESLDGLKIVLMAMILSLEYWVALSLNRSVAILFEIRRISIDYGQSFRPFRREPFASSIW
jgi:hypothetical protein